MSTARHILALLRSHVEGEEQQFYSAALQMAAHEARQGHGKLAQEIRELIDQAKASKSVIEKKSDPIPLVQPKGDLAIVTIQVPEIECDIYAPVSNLTSQSTPNKIPIETEI